MMVQVDSVELAKLETEVQRLKAREQELLESNTALVKQLREVTSLRKMIFGAALSHQVREFHEAFGVPSPPVPTVPDDETVRLRLRLIAEEFFELMHACSTPAGNGSYAYAIDAVRDWIEDEKAIFVVPADLPEIADALADIDYVVEGTRQVFGINGKPIADEVHFCNIKKLGGAKREDGKIEKPPGWQPPDVAGQLRKQGWRG